MANLVSAGVSVTVTDESFFIPASAPTVPLIFVATADEKLQPDGLTPASGTYEYDVIRTVTSLKQSTELYGIPRFLEDTSGNPYHGDARNEYGVFALNQFLGTGNRAFVIRSNVNLNDDLTDLRNMWDAKMQESAYTLENLINVYLSEYNAANDLIPSTTGAILSLGTIVPGSLYTDGTYYNVPLTGGTPTAVATANITVASGLATTLGAITSGSLYTPGTYYNVPLTGAGTGATATVVVGSGSVLALSAITPGTLYTNGTYYNVPLVPTVGPGVGATADITVIAGAVTMVTMKNRGSGYSVGNILTAPSLPVGSGFSVPVATLTTAVTAVTLVNKGTGYVAGGSLTASAANLGGTGSGFSVLVSTVTDNVVTSVTIVNSGAGYLITDVLSALNTNLGGTGAGFSVPVSAVTAYKVTVTSSELLSLTTEATADLFNSFSFKNLETLFMANHTVTPLNVYANGFNNPVTGYFIGFAGAEQEWVANSMGDTVVGEWSPAEASNMLLAVSDDFKFTQEFQSGTSLGANDAARRVAITTALQASINGNTDIRSDNFDYNLVLCPGFPELADELLALVADIGEEAFVIGETPFNKDPAATVTWAATAERQSSANIAYYYPHGLASNIDGKNVCCAASGIALRTLTYSDNVSQLWYPPAGTRRGLVTGISLVGYVSGTLGGPTTFVESNLNQGQRDDLYKYFTNINPIVFFPGRGIVVWGQKTSATDASAMDRISVSRLIKYIKRQLRKNTMSFVFEPNDQLTRDSLKAVVDSFLGNLIVTRGLYDFVTVCDSTNNTPDRIDRNEMYIDVALKPVKAAEFIYIPIRIVATGASLTA